MSFPHNGKALRWFSTQWKECFHTVERILICGLVALNVWQGIVLDRWRTKAAEEAAWAVAVEEEANEFLHQYDGKRSE